jgi:hypothetical protein
MDLVMASCSQALTTAIRHHRDRVVQWVAIEGPESLLDLCYSSNHLLDLGGVSQHFGMAAAMLPNSRDRSSRGYCSGQSLLQ